MAHDYRRIIVAPILNEKALDLKDHYNVYTFKVMKNANKIMIREAVERLFNVTVIAVNTMIVKGKIKRQGRYEGKRPDWKKAMVKLSVDQTIEAFNIGGS